MIARSACETAVPRPPDVQWEPLWDAGWRWLGTLGLYSCPDCPPVVAADEQDRGPAKVSPESTMSPGASG